MTEDEISDLFREMREDAIPADFAGAGSVESERSNPAAHPALRWTTKAWVMACAVVALAVLLVIQPRPAIRRTAAMAVAAPKPEAPPAELPQATPAAGASACVIQRKRRRTGDSLSACIDSN